MGQSKLFIAGVAFWLGCVLFGGIALLNPTGAVSGAGMLQTPGATVDPGQRTPDADATPSVSPTRPATTPTNTPTATPRVGTLNVSPRSATAGAEVTIAGSGFSPSALIVVIVEDSNGATVSYTQPSVEASGSFTMRLDTTTWSAGEYVVSAASLPNVNVLSRASLTLTGMPGLPNTGDGGATSRAPWVAMLFVGAAAVALLALGGGTARRRRA